MSRGGSSNIPKGVKSGLGSDRTGHVVQGGTKGKLMRFEEVEKRDREP